MQDYHKYDPPTLEWENEKTSNRGPFLRYQNYRYRPRNKSTTKPTVQFICSKTSCKKSVWINFYKSDHQDCWMIVREQGEHYITKYGKQMIHKPNYTKEHWERRLATVEIILKIQKEGSHHETYNKFLRENPSQALLFHSYRDIKSKLYRSVTSNSNRTRITSKQQFSMYIDKYYKWNHFKHQNINSCDDTIFKINGEYPKTLMESGLNTTNDLGNNRLRMLTNYKLENLKSINNLYKQNKQLTKQINMSRPISFTHAPSEIELLFYQGNGGNHDFQVWFTKRFVIQLINVFDLLCDCTFAITPRFTLSTNKTTIAYSQLFSAQTLYCATDPTQNVNEALPGLFILLDNKHSLTYRKAFKYTVNRIKEAYGYDVTQKRNLKRKASFDYEIAERQEFCNAFSVDICGGCLFHLSSNFRKQIKKKKLSDAIQYKIEDENKNKITKFTKLGHIYKQIKCIGLLPIDKMVQGWVYVREQLKINCPDVYNSQLIQYIEYIESNYINADNKKTTFSKQDWNFFRSQQRTQSQIERSHQNWVKKLGHHPPPDKFLRGLQEIDADTHVRCIQIYNDKITNKKKPQERLKEKHLNKLWNLIELNEIEIKDFLYCTSILMNFHWNKLKHVYDDIRIQYDDSYFKISEN